jgi:hypothetical protein
VALEAVHRAGAGEAMKGITSRFVLLIGTAAVGPLVIYGLVSVNSLRTGNTRTIREGNERVAAQVAEHVSLYVQNNIRVLRSVGSDLGASRLERWQQDPSSRTTRSIFLNSERFRCSIRTASSLLPAGRVRPPSAFPNKSLRRPAWTSRP